MPGGRPTDYDPSFCEKVIELGKQGESLASFACEFEVTRETLYQWAKTHQQFSDALEKAKTFSLKWWEKTAKERMVEEPGGLKLNQGIWSRSMAARFPDDYRENSNVTLNGNVNLTPNLPNDQDREAQERFILAEAEKIKARLALEKNTIVGNALAIEDKTKVE